MIRRFQPRTKTLAVLLDGGLLVLIRCSEFAAPTDVLNWYAEKYAFDRRKLTWASADDVVECPLNELYPSSQPL